MSSLGTQALLSPKQHSATGWERIWRMWILNGNFLLVFSLSDGKVTSKLELCQGVCRNMSSGEGALLAALAHKVLRGSQLYWRTANWNWEELSAPLTNVTLQDCIWSAEKLKRNSLFPRWADWSGSFGPWLYRAAHSDSGTWWQKTPVQTDSFGVLYTPVSHPKGLCVPAGAVSFFLHCLQCNFRPAWG